MGERNGIGGDLTGWLFPSVIGSCLTVFALRLLTSFTSVSRLFVSLPHSFSSGGGDTRDGHTTEDGAK